MIADCGHPRKFFELLESPRSDDSLPWPTTRTSLTPCLSEAYFDPGRRKLALIAKFDDRSTGWEIGVKMASAHWTLENCPLKFVTLFKSMEYVYE